MCSSDLYVVPFIIMTSVVMSTIGVLLGLLVTGTPFGIIMTGIGVISLAGVVVNNAIVLLDYAEQTAGRIMNPNVFALSAASLSTHRKCGKLLRDAVSRAIEPSGVPKHLPAAPTPPSDLLVHAARHEHAVNLADLLFRRVGLGWTATMGAETAESAARKVAHLMGWDEAKVAREVAAYRAEIDTSFMARP